MRLAPSFVRLPVCFLMFCATYIHIKGVRDFVRNRLSTENVITDNTMLLCSAGKHVSLWTHISRKGKLLRRT